MWKLLFFAQRYLSYDCLLHVYGWLHERARWSKSCVLIGYPSGQDGPILPAQNCLLCSRNHLGVIFWPYNKPFIDQACLVKMIGYWPHYFLCFLWTSTSSQSTKMQKKKRISNIQYPAILNSCLVNNREYFRNTLEIFRCTKKLYMNISYLCLIFPYVSCHFEFLWCHMVAAFVENGVVFFCLQQLGNHVIS